MRLFGLVVPILEIRATGVAPRTFSLTVEFLLFVDGKEQLADCSTLCAGSALVGRSEVC